MRYSKPSAGKVEREFMGKKVKKKKPSTERRPHEVKDLFETAYGYHVKGNYPKAEETYKQIIRMEPRHSNALNLLGTICLERGEYDNALDLIRKAVKAYPMGAMFHNNLGNVFRKMGMVQDAEKAYREALRVAPDNVAANNNLGIVLHEQGDMEGAIGYYEKAHRHDPGFSPAFYNLGRVFCEQGRIETSIWAYREALKINIGSHDAYSNLLYTLHFSDNVTPEQIFDEHRVWAKSFAETYYPTKPVYANNTDKVRRLRIGYVSPDFRTHSVAFFFENVISYHDRNQVEVFCYSSTEKPDDLTRHFKELADGWRDISCLSDDEAASMIKKDQIDILVDLAGHTRGSRILIFARKPAPVQVTWLGYPDTTGLDTMDYRLTDAIADPPGLTDHLSTEKLVRLDGGFLCYRPSGESYPISPSPFIAAGAVTFGSFNNNSKISESVISVWAQIMKKTPGSRLKLKSRSFADFGTRRYILERFDHYGIPAERIWFEGYKVSMKEHFLLYGTVDIALDTFPYNGTTTTCEALWMGVPVIVLKGTTHASRVGSSLLHQVGLDDFVASSEEEYIEKAVALSKDTNLLTGLRLIMRERLSGSNLFNSIVFSSKIEAAFRDMWEEWVKNGAGMSDENMSRHNDLFFEKNLMTLRKYHPHIDLLKNEKIPFDMEVRLTSSGIPNLFIKNEQNGTFAIYPEKNPLEDVAYIKKTIEPIEGKVLCVMGSGLFIHAKPILETIGNNNLVVFFEAYSSVFKKALEIQDLTEVITHPNVRFAIGDNSDPYIIINEERDKIFTDDNGEFVEYNRVVSLAPEWYKDKKKAFDQFLKRRKISLDTAVFSGKSFLANSFKNLLALTDSLPLNTLHDVYKGKPAIIVAAGPSLSKNIHVLQNMRDKALIISVDSALAPLMAVGIMPHMVASVDNNDFTYEKLAPFIDDLDKMDLLYIPSVTSKIANGIGFRSKYYSFPDTTSQNLFNQLLQRNGEALEDIHSVVHLAIAAAQTAGCDPIIFTGLDLAFSGAQDHASGTILNWGNSEVNSTSEVRVESIHGDMIPSTHGFVGMIEICQRMIQNVQGRTYIDATEGGAKVGGTTIRTLAITVENFCDQPIERFEIKATKMFFPSLKDVLHELKKLNDDLRAALQKIDLYLTEHERVEQYLREHPETTDPGVLPDKIVRAVKKMDKINSKLDHDRTVLFVKSIMLESYDRYKELELGVMGNSASKGHRFVAALKQQVFVQNIRQIGLKFLFSQVCSIIPVFEMIINMERQLALSDKHLFDQIGQLIDQGYLVMAETLLSKVVPCAEKDYYSGCIGVKQGKIEKAKSRMEDAVNRENALSNLIERFLKSEIQSLLSQNGPETFRILMLKRAFSLCDPAVPETVEICRNYVRDHAVSMIINSQLDHAVSFLSEACGNISVGSPDIMALLGYTLISQGNSDGLVYLKKSTDMDFNGESRKSFIRLFFYNNRSFNSEQFMAFVLPALVATAPHEPWVNKQCQELWLIDFWDAEMEFFLMRFNDQRVNEADKLLEKWNDISEMIPEWHFMKAMCETARGNRETAIAHMERAVAIDLNTFDSHYGKGNLLYMLSWMYFFDGKDDEGLKCIERAARMTSRIDLYLMHAFFLVRLGQRGKAEIILCDTESLECEKEPWVQHFQELFHNGEMMERIVKVSALKPYAAWMASLAWIMFECEMDDMGLIHLEASIDNDPGAAFIWEELGDLFSVLLDYESALTAYERCLAVFPDRVSIFIKMGDVYYKNGNMKSAQLAYETAIIKDPENSVVLEHLRRIDNQK
ncbi:MAG: tetratricopeptide repeat protein [Desulfobacteraceae bacterium]|jgi:predicted O-linked N-acetylglucosamine transferase (SPINDLY family)